MLKFSIELMLFGALGTPIGTAYLKVKINSICREAGSVYRMSSEEDMPGTTSGEQSEDLTVENSGDESTDLTDENHEEGSADLMEVRSEQEWSSDISEEFSGEKGSADLTEENGPGGLEASDIPVYR